MKLDKQYLVEMSRVSLCMLHQFRKCVTGYFALCWFVGHGLNQNYFTVEFPMTDHVTVCCRLNKVRGPHANRASRVKSSICVIKMLSAGLWNRLNWTYSYSL